MEGGHGAVVGLAWGVVVHVEEALVDDRAEAVVVAAVTYDSSALPFHALVTRRFLATLAPH